MAEIVFQQQIFRRRDGESVLDALVRGGSSLPFSCRRGTCHACLLRVVEGEPPAVSREGLSEELVASGHFLPCQDHESTALVLEEPDFSWSWVEAMLVHREDITPSIFRVRVRPKTPLRWMPGQYIHVRDDDEQVRPYCITNQGQRANFVEFYVQRVPGGRFSEWLATLPIGARLSVQGPHGRLVWQEGYRTLPIVGFAEGVAAGSLRAMLQDALVRGHEGPIDVHLLHTADTDALDAELWAQLVDKHGNLRLDRHADQAALLSVCAPSAFEEHLVYITGTPIVVGALRAESILAGAARRDIRATAFEPADDFWPEDYNPFDLFTPDPALWAALDEGRVMRAVLETFYTELYEDPLLNPFFENVTKQRAISKQYAFLADAFSGTRDYIGFKPFNAHHWMVISEELFDYREEMFERHLRAHGVDDTIVRRWLAYQERFRREIVKHRARGLIVDGEERYLEGFSMEQLSCGSVCDGCGSEMFAGDWGRLHLRTGQLFCENCRAEASNVALQSP